MTGILTAAILLSQLLSGCSVQKALQDQPDPDVSVVKVGTNRERILERLGEPAVAYKGNQGGVDLFRLKRGSPADPARALGWAGLDLFTLGLWEIVGSSVEDNLRPSLLMAVGYDEEGTVMHFIADPYH